MTYILRMLYSAKKSKKSRKCRKCQYNYIIFTLLAFLFVKSLIVSCKYNLYRLLIQPPLQILLLNLLTFPGSMLSAVNFFISFYLENDLSALATVTGIVSKIRNAVGMLGHFTRRPYWCAPHTSHTGAARPCSNAATLFFNYKAKLAFQEVLVLNSQKKKKKLKIKNVLICLNCS